MAIEKLNALAELDKIPGILPAVVVRKGHAGMVTRRIAAVEAVTDGMADADVVCLPTAYAVACAAGEVPGRTLLTGDVKSPEQFLGTIPDGWGVPFIIDVETLTVIHHMMVTAKCGSIKIEPVSTGQGIPFTCHDAESGEVRIAGLLSPYVPKNDSPVGDFVRKLFRLFRV